MTEQIKNNMSVVLSTIRQVMDKNGCFYFEDLAQSGLSQVEVRQALAYLNEQGQTIIKMRSEFGFWQWLNAYWQRAELAK